MLYIGAKNGKKENVDADFSYGYQALQNRSIHQLKAYSGRGDVFFPIISLAVERKEKNAAAQSIAEGHSVECQKKPAKGKGGR